MKMSTKFLFNNKDDDDDDHIQQTYIQKII